MLVSALRHDHSVLSLKGSNLDRRYRQDARAARYNTRIVGEHVTPAMTSKNRPKMDLAAQQATFAACNTTSVFLIQHICVTRSCTIVVSRL